MTVGDRLLELAHTDERAVLFTIVEGPGAGARLLVLLDRDETVGDAPAAMTTMSALPGFSGRVGTKAGSRTTIWSE